MPGFGEEEEEFSFFERFQEMPRNGEASETETDEKEAKRVTFFTLWWQVDMEMSVRIRCRVGEGKEMEKKERNDGHGVSYASFSLNSDPRI